jgi:HTH-type transcriptional regulator / antitoxin HipB
MLLENGQLLKLADALKKERKRQGVSREQAASVCNVSTSFIRDAETDPERCTLGLLLKLVDGLGLRIKVEGWDGEFGAIDDYSNADPLSKIYQTPPADTDGEMDRP